MYINGVFFGGGCFYFAIFILFCWGFFFVVGFCWICLLGGVGFVFFRPTKTNSTKPILFQIDKKRTNQYYKGVLKISSQHQRVS